QQDANDLGSASAGAAHPRMEPGAARRAIVTRPGGETPLKTARRAAAGHANGMGLESQTPGAPTGGSRIVTGSARAVGIAPEPLIYCASAIAWRSKRRAFGHLLGLNHQSGRFIRASSGKARLHCGGAHQSNR